MTAASRSCRGASQSRAPGRQTTALLLLLAMLGGAAWSQEAETSQEAESVDGAQPQQDPAMAVESAAEDPEAVEPDPSVTSETVGSPIWRVMEAGGLTAEVAALIMTGQQGGTLLFEALTLPVSVSGRVPFLLEIDGTDLLADQVDETLQLEIYLYSLTPSGGLADSLLKVIELDLDRTREDLARSGIRVRGDLKLTEGDYSVRILVRNRGTSSLGLRVTPILVAGAGSPEPAPGARRADSAKVRGGLSAALPQQTRPRGSTRMLLPPLIGQPKAAWLSLDLSRDGGNPTAWPALDVGTPGARPVIVAGRKVDLTVITSHLPPDEEIRLEVTRFDGSPVDLLPVSIADRTALLGADWMRMSATFDADDLGPGDYLGRLLLGEGDKVWSSQIPIHVLANAYDRDVVWAELTGDTSALTGGSGDGEVTTNVKPKLALPTEQVAEGYLDTLRIYADGRTQAAIRNLSALETAALGGSGTALDRLLKVEVRAIDRLAANDPDLLIPIAQLHRDMYEAKYAQRQYLLSTHARRMIVELADLYISIGPPDSSKPIAASYLAGLAARLLDAGMPVFADEMFNRALRLDSANRTSLLCLATGLERRGQYGEAIERLRRLVEADPKHWEGQLRLAVNLEREGRFTEAESIYLRVIDSADEEWTVSVAFQELASAYLRRDRPQDAERVLSQGIERLPNEQKLLLQRAFLLDSRRDPYGSSRVLDSLTPSVGEADSPRFRYSQLPIEALDVARGELDEMAVAKLSDLKDALRSQSGAGP